MQWAYKSYEAGQKANPNLNFDYQMALLQGQMGNLENMTTKLFDYAYANPHALVNVQNQLSYFLQEDTEGTFLASLKKELLLRTQKIRISSGINFRVGSIFNKKNTVKHLYKKKLSTNVILNLLKTSFN